MQLLARLLLKLFLLVLVGSSLSLRCYDSQCQVEEESDNCTDTNVLVEVDCYKYDYNDQGSRRQLKMTPNMKKSENFLGGVGRQAKAGYHYYCSKTIVTKEYQEGGYTFKKGEIDRSCERETDELALECVKGTTTTTCICNKDLCNGEGLPRPIHFLEFGGIMVSLYAMRNTYLL